MTRWFRSAVALICILSFNPFSTVAAGTAEVREWSVPWANSRPRDPWVYEDMVWFVGQVTDYVARFDPASGEFRQYPLADGAGPHTVIVDQRGAWYAGNRSQHLGRVDPQSGAITRFPLPGQGPRDIHTMAFDSHDNIWFSVQAGNQLGFFNSASQAIRLYDVPTPHARPYGLIVENDKPWATLFGSYKLVTVENDKIVEVELPRKEARPRRLAMTSDGRVWYVDYIGGFLGRYDSETRKFQEWPMPGGKESRPYGMAADRNDHLWFVETGLSPNRLVGFDPATQEFTKPVAIPSGGGSVRHMFYDASQHVIWFGTDANTLGRARLPE